jgi:type IV fimbrial biogenesis protein FimT
MLGRGLTLMEFLVVTVLLGVLMTLGASSLTPLRQKYHLQIQSEDLLSSLFLARSEALKRGTRVTACVSMDAVHCQTTGNWDQGWLVFEDTDGNATRAETEPLVLTHVAMPQGLLASGNGPVMHFVSYAPTGRSLLVSGGFQAGTITLCRTSAGVTEGWKLVINAVGKPRLDKATLPSCS